MPKITFDTVADTKDEMADVLVTYATGMLVMAQRFKGNVPSLPMPAEFQVLDILNADLAAKMVTFRAILGNAE